MTPRNPNGPKNGAGYLDNARTRWKTARLPDWLDLLARTADSYVAHGKNLTALSVKTGIRASSLSGVLGNTYPGKLGPIEAKVRGTLMQAVVECPALGMPIGRDACAANQQKKFTACNPASAKFPRACAGCANAFAKEKAA